MLNFGLTQKFVQKSNSFIKRIQIKNAPSSVDIVLQNSVQILTDKDPLF